MNANSLIIPKGYWQLPDSLDWAEVAESLDLQAQVLKWVAEPLSRLKQDYGYQSEDIVALWPNTPNLDEILARFEQEHHHTDDEVRVILHGEGVFGIVPPDAEPFTLTLKPGDWIVIPAHTRHWFTLGELKTVVALRVFKDNPAWEAIYDPLT